MWIYKNIIVEELPDCVGFVYLITNKASGRMYVGKKLAKFSKTTYKMVKLKNGTKKKKKSRSKIDSDWIEWKDTDCLLKVQLQAEGKYMEKERRDTDSFLRHRMQQRGK